MINKVLIDLELCHTFVWGVLEEDMVDAVVLEHPIWIIAPAKVWGDVEKRPLCLCLVDCEV